MFVNEFARIHDGLFISCDGFACLFACNALLRKQSASRVKLRFTGYRYSSHFELLLVHSMPITLGSSLHLGKKPFPDRIP